MATTKANKESGKEGKFFYAVGRRKTAVTQARLYPVTGEPSAEADITVNEKDFRTYFPTDGLRGILLGPLQLTGMIGQFRVTLLSRGGGQTGQADAARLAIARALTEYDAALRPTLKAAGMLVRDARKVERKKYGLKKARRAPQWSKR